MPGSEEAAAEAHDPPVEVGAKCHVTPKPAVWEGRGAEEPVTLPPFVPLSVDSSQGSKMEARLHVRLARMQMEKEKQ